jgi:hypothetical protein
MPRLRKCSSTLAEPGGRRDAAGVEPMEPQLGADGSWKMWAHDPDGTSLGFHQYTPESSQYAGADCRVDRG